MVINVPSKLYRYSIDAELQRSDVAKKKFFVLPSRHTTLNKRWNNVVFLRWINVDFELDMEVEPTLLFNVEK